MAPSRLSVQPNVTPMIDVMLVLLIIFMLVLPVMDGVRAEPPRGVHLRAHPEEPADHVLGIDAGGRFYLDRAPVAPRALGARLRALYAGRAEDRVLYVKAHRELDYGIVLGALDEAARSGVRVTGMIAEQQQQQQQRRGAARGRP